MFGYYGIVQEINLRKFFSESCGTAQRAEISYSMIGQNIKQFTVGHIVLHLINLCQDL